MEETYNGRHGRNERLGKDENNGGSSVKIRMHVAADSGGKVVWPEIRVGQIEVTSVEELKELLGEGAVIAWFLRTWAGSVTPLAADDPRIEQDGFLLRLSSTAIRSGMKAECAVVA